MELFIRICCDNGAFHDDHGEKVHGLEVARILRELADDLEGINDLGDIESATRLADVNGNEVGSWNTVK